jgi:hypothetical protein
LQTVAANSQGRNIKELTTPPKQCLQTSLQTKSKKSKKAAANQDNNLHPGLAEIMAVWMLPNKPIECLKIIENT